LKKRNTKKENETKFRPATLNLCGCKNINKNQINELKKFGSVKN